MTDYNDGKIHGWNGGECPVHPKTWVTYWLRDGECSEGYDLDWQHDDVGADIIAFRVTKVHLEPKTIWVNEYRDGRPHAHSTEIGAKNSAHGDATRIAVKYQEVISKMTNEELIAHLRSWDGSLFDDDAYEAADRIEYLKAEVEWLYEGWQDANAAALTNAYDLYAAEAAAYEAAANTCDNVTNNNDFTRDMRRTSSYCAKRIRALATPDQTAALDRVRAEAKAEGMRAAYDSLFKHPGFLHQISGQTFKAVKLEDAAEGILAAIPKEGV